MNMLKAMWCRCEQCLGTFTILLVEAFSETGLFRHLSDSVCRVRNFENRKSMRVIFFFKTFKIQTRIENCKKKKTENFFCLSDNCVWIGIVKVSLWGTRYFSLAFNMLRRSPNILHVNKRDFFQLKFLHRDRWIWFRKSFLFLRELHLNWYL